MAESGAICTTYSRWMELQTRANRQLGKLWQEHQRYAGLMINKAANSKGVGDFTSSKISTLVEGYATPLMFNLTEPGYGTTVNGNSLNVASKMICDVCTQTYQRTYQSIIKTHPDIAACTIACNYVEPFDPDKPTKPLASARPTHQLKKSETINAPKSSTTAKD